MTRTDAMRAAQALFPAQQLPAGQVWDNAEDRHTAYQVLNRVRASLLDDDWPKKVFAFHRLYQHPTGNGSIQPLAAHRTVLRSRLLLEEANETIDAANRGDLLEIIDGCLDTIYVAIGWMLELGLTPEQINMAMEEVHASNMTKVDSTGQPIYDEGGKVLKGDNYVKVNLAAVLGLVVGGELPPEATPADS